jgi:hypothetical protein
MEDNLPGQGSPFAGTDDPCRPAPTRSWSWTRTVLIVAPLCWLFVFITEAMRMESWKLATSAQAITGPALRGLEYVLLLPVLLVAVRATVAIGCRGPGAGWRIAGQVFIGVIFSALAHPARLAAAAWLACAWARAMNYVLVVGIVAGVKTFADLAAQTMVDRMSELLRRILSAGATQFVSLRRELDLLEHYLDIQQPVGSVAPRPVDLTIPLINAAAPPVNPQVDSTLLPARSVAA